MMEAPYIVGLTALCTLHPANQPASQPASQRFHKSPYLESLRAKNPIDSFRDNLLVSQGVAMRDWLKIKDPWVEIQR